MARTFGSFMWSSPFSSSLKSMITSSLSSASPPPGLTIRFDWHSAGAGRGCGELIRSLRGISTLLWGLDYLLQVQVAVQWIVLGFVFSVSPMCPLACTPIPHEEPTQAHTRHRYLTLSFPRTRSQSKLLLFMSENAGSNSVTATSNALWCHLANSQ